MSNGPDLPLWRRLLWFAALWAAGVATVAAVGFAIRWWLS
ncbi:DUF2474 domain-containing protein [Pseudaminobacter sp. 19-2017]|uniref:DUF2474 domain-containing protein n=1 Tax=Pseudaminobacter soli (ex Zhang et al. 2022) TaxID=2831468 RepID=A0A942DYZ3_9HYPH|nr:DUF2474 domain-containing protein [Pseudaminobacter soli]MBS3649732.1 DUF2474 domain-containing protein [Pseudaminobacter soli]